MSTYPPGSLMSFLAEVPDPRDPVGKRHPLVAILTHACCAILCGCRGYAAITQWGRDQPVELMHRLGYRRASASYGTIQGALSRIDPAALEAALARWAALLIGEPAVAALQAVALDGKTARGSLSAHAAAVHLLAAMDQRTGCVLGQMAVDSKTNEHKAALELLRGLALEGRVVTGDAMFCQRDLSEQITRAGGHYLWKVDDNQPSLKEAIAQAFEPAFSPLRPASPGRRA
jgi:DDE_Tnp_1-associated/Transposase DDE domain